MSNRRKFLQRIFTGTVVAPVIIQQLPDILVEITKAPVVPEFGDWSGIALPRIKQVFPDPICASDWVSRQPMDGPTNVVIHHDFRKVWTGDDVLKEWEPYLM